MGTRVIVIGAGFGGLGAAKVLRQHGIDDTTILERARDVGKRRLPEVDWASSGAGVTACLPHSCGGEAVST
jgi:monoamine oxidase